MAEQATVDTLGMRRAGEIIITTRGAAVNIQNDVRDDIAALKTAWTDAGAPEFHAAMDNWLATYNTVVRELGVIGDLLDDNTTTYQTAIANVTDQAASLARLAEQRGSGFAEL